MPHHPDPHPVAALLTLLRERLAASDFQIAERLLADCLAHTERKPNR